MIMQQKPSTQKHTPITPYSRIPEQKYLNLCDGYFSWTRAPFSKLCKLTYTSPIRLNQRPFNGTAHITEQTTPTFHHQCQIIFRHLQFACTSIAAAKTLHYKWLPPSKVFFFCTQPSFCINKKNFTDLLQQKKTSTPTHIELDLFNISMLDK